MTKVSYIKCDNCFCEIDNTYYERGNKHYCCTDCMCKDCLEYTKKELKK